MQQKLMMVWCALLVFGCSGGGKKEGALVGAIGQGSNPVGAPGISTRTQANPPIRLAYDGSMEVKEQLSTEGNWKVLELKLPAGSAQALAGLRVEYLDKVAGVTSRDTLFDYLSGKFPMQKWEDNDRFPALATFAAKVPDQVYRGGMIEEYYMLSDDRELYRVWFRPGSDAITSAQVRDAFASLALDLQAPEILEVSVSDEQPSPGDQVELRVKWKDDFSSAISFIPSDVQSAEDRKEFGGMASWLGYDLPHTFGKLSPAYAFSILGSGGFEEEPGVYFGGSFYVPTHTPATKIVVGGVAISDGHRTTFITLDSEKKGENDRYLANYRLVKGRMANGLSSPKILPQLEFGHRTDTKAPELVDARLFLDKGEDANIVQLDLDVEDLGGVPADEGYVQVDFRIENEKGQSMPEECRDQGWPFSEEHSNVVSVPLQFVECDFLEKSREITIRPSYVRLSDDVFNTAEWTTLPGNPVLKVPAEDLR